MENIGRPPVSRPREADHRNDSNVLTLLRKDKGDYIMAVLSGDEEVRNGRELQPSAINLGNISLDRGELLP
jgi:hypothetical protein